MKACANHVSFVEIHHKTLNLKLVLTEETIQQATQNCISNFCLIHGVVNFSFSVLCRLLKVLHLQ